MSDYSNWREFARNICLPMIGDDEAALSVAEKEFDRQLKENRYYFAAGFVIAENMVTRQENLIDAALVLCDDRPAGSVMDADAVMKWIEKIRSALTTPSEAVA